ncbi:MAG: rhodanese-like domain-containing protein [Phycisphaerales bacterium]|nr:rhodanese-like domain-containing protein [Phycisphaerales bacterium]
MLLTFAEACSRGVRSIWMPLGLLAMLAFALLAGGCEKDTRDSDIVYVKLGEVSELWRDSEGNPMKLLLIDPRPQPEFEAGHIPGARNILLTKLDGNKGRDPRIEAYENVMVYGEDPASPIARAVAKRMIAMEYPDSRFFAGGIKEWKAANLPLEKGPSKPLPPARSTSTRGRARQ